MLAPLVLLAALPVVQLDVHPQTRCGLMTRLAPALAESGLRVVPHAEHRVDVSSRAERIFIRVRDGAGRVLLSRTLAPADDECDVVPRTLALLLRSTLAVAAPVSSAAPPSQAPSAPPRDPPQPEPTPPAAAPGEIASAAPTAVVTGETATSFRPAPPAADPLPPEPAADAGAAQVLAIADAGTAPARSTTFTLTAAGGGSLDSTVVPVGHLTAAFEWAFRPRWRAGLEVGLDSVRSRDAPPGRITVSVYWASLAVRRALFTFGEVTGLWAGVGIRGLLLQAGATGFSVSRRDVMLGTGGFFAALDWRQAIWRGLLLYARLGGLALIRAERFHIAGVEPVLVLPEWSAFGQLGLGLDF